MVSLARIERVMDRYGLDYAEARRRCLQQSGQSQGPHRCRRPSQPRPGEMA